MSENSNQCILNMKFDQIKANYSLISSAIQNTKIEIDIWIRKIFTIFNNASHVVQMKPGKHITYKILDNKSLAMWIINFVTYQIWCALILPFNKIQIEILKKVKLK